VLGAGGVHWFGPLSVASKTQPPLPSSFQRPAAVGPDAGEH
jgi:hypothetical protein